MATNDVEERAADPVSPAGDEPPFRLVTPLRVVGAIALVALMAMWAFAESPLAVRPAPDALVDTSVGPRAEAVCQETTAQLDALPRANKTPDPNGRADVVVESDVLLGTMLDRLAPIPIGGDAQDRQRDQRIYDEWIADWRTYLGNRDDYARRLRTDRNARIYLDRKGAKQITDPIGGFATANRMPSCKPPGDIY